MKKIIFKSLLASTVILASTTYAVAQDCNAHFSHTQRTDNAYTVSFEPVGASAVIAYEWTFGDGTPISSAHSPVHTYAEDGLYTFCLTIRTADDSCTVCTDICVNSGSTTSVGDLGLKENSIRIFPNPSADVWNLEIYLKRAGDVDIQLADVAGKMIYQNSLKGRAGKNVAIISNQHLPAGVYFTTISNGREQVVKKALKE